MGKNPPLLDKNFDLKFNKLFLKLLFKKKQILIYIMHFS